MYSPEMKVLHEAEEPYSWVLDSLQQTRPYGTLLSLIDLVSLKTVVGMLAFRGGEPSGVEGTVRKERVGDESNKTRSSTLDDE